MKNIVILPNPNKDIGFNVTNKLVANLKKLGFTTYAQRSFLDISGCVYYDSFPKDAELIVVVGGDGSVIDASKYAIENDIPIIGVNLGKVGYLTEVDPSNMDVFENLVNGDYKIENKMLLSAEICGQSRVACERLAVNDVVISHSNFFGICEFLRRKIQG